jgi:hypothetical protein
MLIGLHPWQSSSAPRIFLFDLKYRLLPGVLYFESQINATLICVAR